MGWWSGSWLEIMSPFSSASSSLWRRLPRRAGPLRKLPGILPTRLTRIELCGLAFSSVLLLVDGCRETLPWLTFAELRATVSGASGWSYSASKPDLSTAERSKFDRPEDGPEDPIRLRLPDDPETMRTTRSPFPGVLISGRGSCRDSGLSSAGLSRASLVPVLLGGRVGRCAPVPLDMEVERLLDGWIWFRLWGVLLSRTTRFLTGLASRLGGLDALLVSGACALPDLKCLRSCDAAAVPDVFNWLPRRLVRGGEGRFSAGSGAPSSSSALVRALSFIGTGISSSELSS